jgi:hypothetical protein
MVLCAIFGSLKDWSEARNKCACVIALSVLAGETALGRTGFTRRRASEYAAFTVPPLRPILDYFGPDTTPAAYARVAIDPKRHLGTVS